MASGENLAKDPRKTNVFLMNVNGYTWSGKSFAYRVSENLLPVLKAHEIAQLFLYVFGAKFSQKLSFVSPLTIHTNLNSFWKDGLNTVRQRGFVQG